jgi:hypothetical protein
MAQAPQLPHISKLSANWFSSEKLGSIFEKLLELSRSKDK